MRTPRSAGLAAAALAAMLAGPLAPARPQAPLEHPYSDTQGHLAGDVDGDGRVDLVEVTNGLRVWHGQGDGTFGPSSFTQAPGAKLPAALGDIDGDGQLDIVFRRTLGGEPLVVGAALATGDGQFAPPTYLELPGSSKLVTALALVDVDGDGDLDLLVGREGEPRLVGFLGDGTGAFAGGADLPGVKGTQQIEAGDVNGDGHLDLVLRGHVVIGGQSIVGVLFGDGTGAYSEPLSVAAPFYVSSVLAADLTGDGHDDLVLLEELPGGEAQLAIWEPHSSGFGPPVTILPVDEGNAVVAARAADLDEDGRDDLVLVDGKATVSVLRQQADGTLAGPVLYGAWWSTRDVLLEDVDENGARDVLAFGDGPATLLAGTGAGTFGPAVGLPAPPRDLASADFDGDGRDEIVSLGFDGGPLLVHDADVLGGWNAPAEVDAGPEGRRVAAGRFTPDALPDLLVVRGGAGTSAVVLVPGAPGGAFETPVVTPLAFPAYDGWTTDVDGDGLTDVLVGDLDGITVHVLLNGGAGAFAETAVLGPFQAPRAAAAADMNGDGETDVVVASVEGNGRLSVFPGVGDGTFLAPVVTEMAPEASWPRNLALGDVDLDGAVDAAAYVGLGATLVLPGLGDGNFGTPAFVEGEILDELLLTDLDRDGMLDLVGARKGTSIFQFGTVHVLHGTGTLAFGPVMDVPAAGGAERLIVTDPDGDGAPDLALAGGLPQFIVLRNAQGPWQDLGHSLAGSNGFSKLTGAGTLQPGSAVELLVTHGPPSAPVLLVVGLDVLLAPFQGGVLVPTADVVVTGLATDASGRLVLAGHWPPGLAPGTDTVFQAWFEDLAIAGVAATTGLSGTTP